MTKSRTRTALLVGTVLAVVGMTATACTAGSASGDDTSGKVTITVGDRPGSDQPDAVKALDKSIAEFEKANPNITIKSVETKWDSQSFQAMVAGGTMPTLLGVPFTEPQGLIKNKQIADMTDALKATGLGDQLNKSVLAVAQDGGKTYGVPTDVYSVGLAYNRKIFTAAGLDPDSPPTTWDEVISDAQAIAKTGATGYATYAADHYGGWMTTAATYSFGGRLENEAGTKATLDTPELTSYLDLISDLRWKDNAMGSNFLYSAAPALQDFAAGKIGMILGLPQDYPTLVQNYKMDAADYGFTGLPQATSKNTTLSGGIVEVASPTATEPQLEAGLKWIEYNRFRAYFDESVAVAGAKATIADKGIVGLPALTPLNQDAYDQYQGWIKPYINVKLENFAGYTKVSDTQTIVPEPKNSAQDLYALLDTVLQAVLTKQDTDIPALLQKSEQAMNQKLAR